MSGAEPCTGSNSDGKARSGFRLAEGAKPMVPFKAAAGAETAPTVNFDMNAPAAPNAFAMTGTPLTSSNLDAHLERLQALQQAYAVANPEVADRIRQFAGTP